MTGAGDSGACLGEVRAHAVVERPGRRRILDADEDEDIGHGSVVVRQDRRISHHGEGQLAVEPRLHVGRVAIAVRQGRGHLIELLVELIGQVLVDLRQREVSKEAAERSALVAGEVEPQLVVDRRVGRDIGSRAHSSAGALGGEREADNQPNPHRQDHDRRGSRDQPTRTRRRSDGRFAAA